MKILGHEYSIVFDHELDKKYSTVANYTASLLKIKLDPTYPETRLEEGLLHEIFEALKYHLNFGDSMPHPMLSQLSEALYEVIKDNQNYFSIKVKR